MFEGAGERKGPELLHFSAVEVSYARDSRHRGLVSERHESVNLKIGGFVRYGTISPVSTEPR